MTYKIVKSPRAWWPVTFPGVTEEGQVIENTFEMRFKLLDEDEQAEVETELRSLGDQAPDAGKRPSELSAAVVMRIAEDWRGVVTDDGTEAGASLPFTHENVATLMKVPNVFFGVAQAYRACRAGQAETRRGN